jgi:hypothetical protein
MNTKDQNDFTLVVSASKPILRGFVPLYITINDEQGNNLALHYGGSWVITITRRLFDEIWYGIRHVYGEKFADGLQSLWLEVDTGYKVMDIDKSTSPKQHTELLGSIKAFVSEYERKSNNKSVEPIDKNIHTLIRIFEWNIEQLTTIVKQ